MTMDISGKTFDPRDNHSDLLIAQGKLTLDSEQNEAADARDRRWRVETMDLVGRAGYPAALPESFQITLGAGGGLEIGPGRMYVDGLLAENHGLSADDGGTVAFDAAHAELRSSTPVPFDQQPYLPGAEPPDPADGDVLVYLDVWRREVNHLKDPSLVEPAIGVDTAGRSQTVWQVRTLGVADGVTCATPDGDIDDWAEIIAPSTIRLSSLLVPVTDPGNPCEIPPGQQLRTTENRTYRVETHGIAEDGSVLLKWSRTNASVATRVRTIDSATQITVAEVARDDVHRFVPGDWIEIVDDRLEFAGEPGLMRMVETADPATNIITFQGAIPAGTFPADADGVPDPDLNLRIIRWDQSGVVSASGGAVLGDMTDPTGPGVFLAPPPGEFVELEAGIAVEIGFAPGPQKVRVGDHWIFRARAATGTIETLDMAPPCGIHHHYTRLAVVEGDADGFQEPIEDCRDPIDPDEECCCTAVVLPGQDIQLAIDQLPPAGGCICLKPGEHQLQQPLQLTRSNVTLHGEAKGVTVIAPGGSPALLLSGTAANPVARIRIHTIAFVGDDLPSSGGGLLNLQGTEDVVISDCDFSADPEEVGIAIQMAASTDISVLNCRIDMAMTGILASERCDEIVVRDCLMTLGGVNGSPGVLGVGMANGIGRIEVSGCTIRGAVAGVVVNDDINAPPASLASNSRVTDCVIDATALPDNVPQGLAFGIDMAAENAEIHGNLITYPSSGQVGIRIAGAHSSVSENRCRYESDNASPVTIGIVVGVANADGDATGQVNDVAVTGNTVEGPQTGIVALNAEDCRIAANRTDGDGLGQSLVGVFAIGCTALEITGNTITQALIAIGAIQGGRCRIDDNRISGGGFGIVTFNQDAPTIRDNRLTDAGLGGILVLATTERTLISDNRVVRCGSAAPVGLGITTLLVIGEAAITGNEVMDTGQGEDDQAAAIAIGILGDLVLEALVEGNLVTYTAEGARDIANEDRALRFRGLLEAALQIGQLSVSLGFPIKILGNSFIGTGQTALVEILQQPLNDNFAIRFERVTFNDNYCMHFAPAPSDARATVSLRGRRGIVMGNHVKSQLGAYFPVNFNGMSATYVGNVGEQPPIQGNPIPVPTGDYNLDS